MNGKVADTAAPPWAVRMWSDNRNVYAELPGVNGPVVMAFAISTGGLSKALNLLSGRHDKEGHGVPYTRMPSTVPDKSGFSEKQRRDTLDMLKRMRVL